MREGHPDPEGAIKKRHRLHFVLSDGQPVSPTGPTVHDLAGWVTAYEACWQDPAAPWRPCPQCTRRRAWHSSRARWVHWAPSQRDHLGLRRLRCRPCHPVETVFPPWLLPYEELPVASLDPLLPAAGLGASWATVAAQTGAAPVTVRRCPQGPGLHQGVLQQATRWGIPLTWPTRGPGRGAVGRLGWARTRLGGYWPSDDYYCYALWSNEPEPCSYATDPTAVPDWSVFGSFTQTGCGSKFPVPLYLYQYRERTTATAAVSSGCGVSNFAGGQNLDLDSSDGKGGESYMLPIAQEMDRG